MLVDGDVYYSDYVLMCKYEITEPRSVNGRDLNPCHPIIYQINYNTPCSYLLSSSTSAQAPQSRPKNQTARDASRKQLFLKFSISPSAP